jgi:hypothetical protein
MDIIIKKTGGCMALICVYCAQDIDAKGQDNMSSQPNYPICEDCYEDKALSVPRIRLRH